MPVSKAVNHQNVFFFGEGNLSQSLISSTDKKKEKKKLSSMMMSSYRSLLSQTKLCVTALLMYLMETAVEGLPLSFQTLGWATSLQQPHVPPTF